MDNIYPRVSIYVYMYVGVGVCVFQSLGMVVINKLMTTLLYSVGPSLGRRVVMLRPVLCCGCACFLFSDCCCYCFPPSQLPPLRLPSLDSLTSS